MNEDEVGCLGLGEADWSQGLGHADDGGSDGSMTTMLTSRNAGNKESLWAYCLMLPLYFLGDVVGDLVSTTYRAGHEKLVFARISLNMRQTKKLSAHYEIPNLILHTRAHFQGVFITDPYYIP